MMKMTMNINQVKKPKRKMSACVLNSVSAKTHLRAFAISKFFSEDYTLGPPLNWNGGKGERIMRGEEKWERKGVEGGAKGGEGCPEFCWHRVGNPISD